MNVSQAPVFIIGTERSGSNLLRLILDAHPDICIPHPPHLMRYFAPLVKECGYGNLDKLPNRTRLAKDMRRLIATHIFPWHYPIDWDYVAEHPPQNSLFGLVAAIYEQVRHAQNCPRWGNKSTFMIHHVPKVLSIYPDAQFIWLIRDPRDVAVSSKVSVFNPFHPRDTGALWQRQQQEGKALEQAYPQHVHRLYYEDLIGDSEVRLKDLCTHIDLDFQPHMLQFFKNSEATKSSSLSQSWVNTGQPIKKDNAGKYRKKLSIQAIKDVESSAKAMMEDCGYQRDYPEYTATKPSLGQRWKSWLEAQRLHALVEWNSLLHDRNDRLRRQRALLMAYLTLRHNPKALRPW